MVGADSAAGSGRNLACRRCAREARSGRVDVLARPAEARSAKAGACGVPPPNYDEFGIAYKDRGLILDERDPRDRRNPAIAGAEFAHLLIVNGRLRGSWRRGVDPASSFVFTGRSPVPSRLSSAGRSKVTRNSSDFPVNLPSRWRNDRSFDDRYNKEQEVRLERL